MSKNEARRLMTMDIGKHREMRIPEISTIKCPTRLTFCEPKRNDLCLVQVDLITNIYYKKTMILTLSSTSLI